MVTGAKPNRIALVERTVFSAIALFAEYPKGARKDGERMFFRFRDGRALEVRAERQMGAFHLLVLEALIAEAQAGMAWQKPAGPRQRDRDLREMMELEGKAAQSDNLTATLSYYAIASCVGRKPSTALRRQIGEALSDLGGTRFIWSDASGRLIESCRLLSCMGFSPDSGTGPITVSICPALSEVMVNARPYARINMDEVRSLDRKVTVLLHGWLSSILAPGQRGAINLDTIIDGKIWAGKAEKGSPTCRTRRSTLLNRLFPDMEKAGWEWNYDPGKDQVVVRRPKWGKNAARKSKGLAVPVNPDAPP